VTLKSFRKEHQSLLQHFCCTSILQFSQIQKLLILIGSRMKTPLEEIHTRMFHFLLVQGTVEILVHVTFQNHFQTNKWFNFRNCIGQKFAQMEEKIILAKLLQNFDIHPTVSSRQEVKGIPDIILRPAEGVFVKLTKRKNV